jgi:hypothetical protein
MRLSLVSAFLASTCLMLGCGNNAVAPVGKKSMGCSDKTVDLAKPEKKVVLCPNDTVRWKDNTAITITFTDLSPFRSGKKTYSSDSGDVTSDEANDPINTEFYPYIVVERNKDGSEKTLPEMHVIVLGGGGIK